MGKPTDEELQIALNAAARMREHDEDPEFLAKSLLNFNYRCKHLEAVLKAAELYLHSGMSTTEHQKLVRAINSYHAQDDRSAGHDSASDFGTL